MDDGTVLTESEKRYRNIFREAGADDALRNLIEVLPIPPNTPVTVEGVKAAVEKELSKRHNNTGMADS